MIPMAMNSQRGRYVKVVPGIKVSPSMPRFRSTRPLTVQTSDGNEIGGLGTHGAKKFG